MDRQLYYALIATETSALAADATSNIAKPSEESDAGIYTTNHHKLTTIVGNTEGERKVVGILNERGRKSRALYKINAPTS